MENPGEGLDQKTELIVIFSFTYSKEQILLEAAQQKSGFRV